VFTIHVSSFLLKTPITVKDKDIFSSLIIQGQNEVKRLFSVFKHSLDYSSSVHKHIDKLIDKSIFLLCLPDGLLMVKVHVARGNAIEMRCTFLSKENGLRMGWRLARWQLLLLTAAEALQTGIYDLTFEEIAKKTDAIKIDEKYLTKVVELGKRIMQEPIPVSYALTAFPSEKLPLDFGDNIVSGYADDYDEVRRLPIDTQNNLLPDRRLFIESEKEKKNYSQYELIVMSKKEYLKEKDDEYKIYDRHQRSEKMETLKQNLEDSQQYLCVQISLYNMENYKYTHFLPTDFYEKIKTGTLKVSELFTQIEDARERADKYFEDYRDVLKKREEEKERIKQEKQQKKADKAKEREEKKQKIKDEREQNKSYRKMGDYSNITASNEGGSESDAERDAEETKLPPSRNIGKVGEAAAAIGEKTQIIGSFFNKLRNKK